MDSRTWTGSGTLAATGPSGLLREAPLETFAVDGRLVVDESGEMSDSDDERGFKPGRKGSGAGRSPGYSLRGAGEAVSRRGGGVPAGVECADSLSILHILLQARICRSNVCLGAVGVAVAFTVTVTVTG